MKQNEQQQGYIGFVSNSAWYIYIHRIDAIRFLIEKGYHILIVAPNDRPVAAFNHPNIKWIELDYSNKSLNPFSAVQLYLQFKKIYQQYKPICVFHYAIKANIFGGFAARNAKVPCIAVINGIGYSFVKRNLLYHLVKRLYRWALSWPKEVWFLNNDDGSFFIQHKMVSTKKVHILHGEGINTSYFMPGLFDAKKADAPFRFIIATRTLYSKGLGTIADATRILKNQGYEFICQLIAVPDPGHPDEVPKQVLKTWEAEGLFSIIPFTEDVRPWLAASDCFLLPSYYNEGLPRCLMEAASMCLPIITTNQKGCKEAITNNQSGFFCKPTDPVDLAEKMAAMMDMPLAKREKMGKNGRLLMQKKFAIERICKEYLRVVKTEEAK